MYDQHDIHDLCDLYDLYDLYYLDHDLGTCYDKGAPLSYLELFTWEALYLTPTNVFGKKKERET